MEDRTAEVRPEMRELVAPLGLEAVLGQCLVLTTDLELLLDVRRETQAAGAAKRVAVKRLQPVECGLGALPEPARSLPPVRVTRNVVARGTPAQGEAAVPPTCAFRDAACIVDTDPQAVLCERERARTARNAGADDRNVDFVELGRTDCLCRLSEPERGL
jgi:hypothetical protein